MKRISFLNLLNLSFPERKGEDFGRNSKIWIDPSSPSAEWFIDMMVNRLGWTRGKYGVLDSSRVNRPLRSALVEKMNFIDRLDSLLVQMPIYLFSVEEKASLKERLKNEADRI